MVMPAAQPNMSIDLARLRQMWNETTPIQPVYPGWFRQPKRPNAQAVHEAAIQRFDEMTEWRMAVRHDLQVLRGAVEGIFPDDYEDYYAGIIDEWSSPALIDEFNLAVSWLSGLQRRFTKAPTSDDLAAETRKVELAAQWLRQAEMRQYTEDMDMGIALLEPKILLSYGFLWKRRVLDKTAEPYASPFTVSYIDPAQVVFTKDAHGIARLYRVYSARAEDLAADYGDFSPSVTKALEKLYGRLDESTEFTSVVEYWDRWYRCVTVGGVEIVPVTEHRYGEVPYTRGIGPLGEPILTVLPNESAGAAMSQETMRANAPHKSVGFIRFMKKQHAQYEAIMKRNLYGLKIQNNPPVARGRSLNAAQLPAPDLVAKPGAQNEYMLGEEKIESFPYPPRIGYDQAAIMEALNRDRMTGRAPLAAYGVFDQSNISGTATKMGMSAGAHLWRPWAAQLDRFIERDMAKAFRLWQRLGHIVEYADERRRPFVVPNERPMKGEPGSFELDRETLARVGPAVIVRSDAQDPSDWITRAQTAKMMSELGMPKPQIFDRLFSLDYDTQMQEEWFEEQALAVAMQNPKFFEMVIAPVMFAAELDEARDDPERAQLLQSLMQGWMRVVVQPAALEQQARTGAMQQQIVGQQQAMTAPTSQQSFSEQGRGPGSVTGVQGGPRGPVGPRSQGVG